MGMSFWMGGGVSKGKKKLGGVDKGCFWGI